MPYPDLLSLAFFWKTARKTTKKTRIFYRCRTPKILGKEGKNGQKSKEFLGKEKRKEIPKSKEKKIRVNPKIVQKSRNNLIDSRVIRANWKFE